MKTARSCIQGMQFLLLLAGMLTITMTGLGRAADSGESLRFAAFTDTHYAQPDSSDYLQNMADDVMNEIRRPDFAMGIGDEVHDRAGWVGDWKKEYVRRLNLPYHYSPGDHDIVNYYNPRFDKGRCPFPYRTLREEMRESELTTPTYAMLRSNILFLVIGDKGPIEKIHETQKEWVEYMVDSYPEKTTVLVSHAPVRGVTGASNRHDWGWRHSEMWWWKLFHENPQIKVFINGDGHCMSWVVDSNNDHEGYGGTNGDWGHDIAFVEPGSQGMFLRDDHNKNDFVVFEITDKALSSRAWRHDDKGTRRVDSFDHRWQVPGGTTYDESAQDWYSFPVFLQDGGQQVLRNDIIPIGDVTLELVGMRPYSLFNNPDIIAGHTSDYEKVSGFGNDNEVTFHRDGHMEVDGPHTLTFPDKTSHGNKEKGGKSGQIKHFLFHGSTPQAIPGKTYHISLTARAEDGGDIRLDMSCSDWHTRNQYTILEGSSQKVLAGHVQGDYKTLSGTYTVPEDRDAWFLQGEIQLAGSTDYSINSLQIKRKSSSRRTKHFRLNLSRHTYEHQGTLDEDEKHAFKVDPTTLTGTHGNLNYRASIGGNRVGMARLIFDAPFAFGRNGRFIIDKSSEDGATLWLLSGPGTTYVDVLKVLPFNDAYSAFSVEPGKVQTSDNGVKYGTLPIGGERKKVQVRLNAE